MRINTTIEVAGDTYPGDEAWAASQVLAALGGNPANDTSTAVINYHKLRFNVQVQLEQDDNMAYTAEQAADQVMAALGGNPTTDYAYVYITMTGAGGEAGVPPDVLPPAGP